jgi:hypothetical protein
MLERNCARTATGLIALAAACISAISAYAADRPGKTVRSCSAYGNGCVTAPVRKAEFGLQTRLPSGTWIDCRGDCRQAIREDLLDFWETQSEKAQIIHGPIR